ncbi:MAG: hypothetical protein IK079_02855, partial [Desulfovibrio sp.]|nr:hypothetical protein [Desulfovibrio sp.]
MENVEQTPKKTRFSGQIGFVLAAAGSAVGLGNIWRFPYLAAKDGGGLFILIYLILLVTFGYVLLISDITIGRKTRKSAIHAYAAIGKKWKILGVLTFLVPALIMTYYTVIGGWISRYVLVYLTGDMVKAAETSYFTSFIASQAEPLFYALFFLVLTGVVIYLGIRGGIERISTWLMPTLFIMVVGIALFVLTIEHVDASGVKRTGL